MPAAGAAAAAMAGAAAGAGLKEASGAQDLFLKFEPEIKSGAGHGAHKDWIEVLSFSFGTSIGISGQAGAEKRAGGTSLSDFTFSTRSVSKASPILFQKCATGEHFDSVQLERIRGGGKSTLETTIVLQDVLISSYSLSGSQGDNWSEAVSLNFSKISYKFQAINARTGDTLGGPVETSYDVQEQKA